MTGCLHTFTRAAYCGGRVEPFRESFVGGVDKARDHYEVSWLNYADVNSMYPWAMLGPVPTELAFVRQGHVDMDRARALGYLGFVECEVSIPLDCYLPPLPFKHKGKLIFPVGIFSGVWTTEELDLLPLVGGRIREIKRSVWFRGDRIFAEYVNHWYKFRDKKSPTYDLAMDMVAKLFLNSLYGKMGMNPEREKLWFYPSDDDFAEHELTPIADVHFACYREVTVSEPPYVIPHIAAWVTSRSRARLFTLMHDFLMRGYRIYYCDTDSIITDAPVVNATELGGLKVECQIRRARFVAPKMYFIERVDGSALIKAKGFSGGFGAKGLTEAEFDGIVNHHLKVRIQRMRKLREGVRSGKRFPAMNTSQKGIRAGILNEKRIVLPDGNTRAIDATSLQ